MNIRKREIIKIVSGGQTGVDLAALDAALELNILVGGYCPKNFTNEDGYIDEKYSLIETNSTNVNLRTYLNVKNSDCTIIFNYQNVTHLTGGTKYTYQICQELNKSYFVFIIGVTKITTLWKWYENNLFQVVNFAGPRESSSPGIYQVSKSIIFHFLNKINK